VLVGERIRALKAERHQAEAALSQLDLQQRQHAGIDLQHACAILDGLPDLSKPLAKTDPELQRRIFEIFHLRVELDRNTPEVRMKALVSSAFSAATDLDDLAATVTDKAIGQFWIRFRPVLAGRRDASLAGLYGRHSSTVRLPLTSANSPAQSSANPLRNPSRPYSSVGTPPGTYIRHI
jgi:hypothetical protein